MHDTDSFSADTNNYMLLVADIFTFFITCSLCTVEGKKGYDVMKTHTFSPLRTFVELAVPLKQRHV